MSLIYLKNCPGDDDSRKWFQSWSNFYTDLFQTQTADQIILTLNRMIKTQDGRVMSEKVLKRIAAILALKYEAIQSMLIPEHAKNTSEKGNYLTLFQIPEGKYLSL